MSLDDVKYDPWLTLAELAKFTGYSALYLQQLCREKKLICRKISNRYFARASDFEIYKAGVRHHPRSGPRSDV